MDKKTERAMQALHKLLRERDAINQRIEAAKEWFAKHAAEPNTITIDGFSLSVAMKTVASVDNRAIRDAAVKNPRLLDGLSPSYRVPASHRLTPEQQMYVKIEEKIVISMREKSC